ncbi:hypothetical protein JMF89_15885 [Clostridiaceae bacterium UIB06]|nr:hypothetical protein [Clostridiaceae bacterium UIB06]
MKNPDDFKSYEPGTFWKSSFFKYDEKFHNERFNIEKNFMVPMNDSKAVENLLKGLTNSRKSY